MDADRPLLRARGVTLHYGSRVGCRDVGLDLWPGEVLGIVGESGSGKTSLLGCLSGRLEPSAGTVEFTQRDGTVVDVLTMPEPALRKLARTDWGIVHQNPRDGLRLGVSAGANVGERLMALGARHYGRIRETAVDWLGRVEIDRERIDDWPETFSSGRPSSSAPTIATIVREPVPRSWSPCSISAEPSRWILTVARGPERPVLYQTAAPTPTPRRIDGSEV